MGGHWEESSHRGGGYMLCKGLIMVPRSHNARGSRTPYVHASTAKAVIGPLTKTWTQNHKGDCIEASAWSLRCGTIISTLDGVSWRLWINWIQFHTNLYTSNSPTISALDLDEDCSPGKKKVHFARRSQENQDPGSQDSLRCQELVLKKRLQAAYTQAQAAGEVERAYQRSRQFTGIR